MHPFRLVVVGAEGVRIPGVAVSCRPWRSETETQDLWDLDIGIMPLPENPWTRGKCAMKAIQYLAMGVPAVVSPVGMNVDVVRHNWNGFHATSEDNWVEYLRRLLIDPGLRNRLGRAGRRTVEGEYSAEVQAPRLAQVLREVASSPTS